MIYATMCIGSDWADKYKKSISNFSKKNKLHILTDNLDIFSESVCYPYNRDVFSYYEKINFILQLSKQYNQRITYLDLDFLDIFDTNYHYDDYTLYTYRLYDLNSENPLTLWFGDIERDLQKNLLSNISCSETINYYIPEALISLPPLYNIDNIISDSKIIQNIIENIYNKNTISKFNRLEKYKNGIGFVEGWGITALSVKYKIPVCDYEWRKMNLI